MKYLLVLPALMLAGCANTGYVEEHKLLNQAHKAELRMDAAKALQASGAALVVKGKADYAKAKEAREKALQELSDRFR